MTGDCHVRFCESRGVRFPPATHQRPVGVAACDPGPGAAPSSYRDGFPRGSHLGHAMKGRGDICTPSADAERRFGVSRLQARGSQKA